MRPTKDCASAADGARFDAQAYLGACADTRKAWHSTRMLSLMRIDQVRHVREVLAHGDADAIAELLCSMSGPMHPGSPQKARDPMAAAGNDLARQLLRAILPGSVAQRDAARSATRKSKPGPRPMLDVDRLKSDIVRWIERGEVDAVRRGGDDDVRKITRFLEQQTPAGHSAGPLRLACAAMTAAAVESALVVTRLSGSWLDAMQASAVAPKAKAEKTAENADPIQPDDEDADQIARAGPMCRDDEDDRAAERAFQNMLRRFG